VLLAVLTGLGSSTAQTGDSIAPFYEEPTTDELDLYDAEVTCPPILDWELTDRVVNATSEVRIECTYRTADNRQERIVVTWMKPDNPNYATSFCEPNTENRPDLVVDDTGHAIKGEPFVSDGVDQTAVQAAIQEMMAGAVPFARECADPPPALECPEVPGHALSESSVDQEADDFQPDTFGFDCRYEPSGPEADDGFSVTVWFAAPRGVPELYDRLCNEPPAEGVGFGVLVADGVAANATFWRFSPLDGPDVEVVRVAAQALLDQAAPHARDCSGAEPLPTRYEAFPDYLHEQFSPALTAGPPPPSGGGLGDLPAAPNTPRIANEGGLVATLLRIGSVVMLAISLLGLFITFLLIRRETRIRERRDLLRIGITLVVSVLAVVIVGRDAPLWAILVAIGLGLALGTWQGANVLVRNTERGLMAKRSLVAIVAFAAGIVLMQVAGLLNRTGGVALGVATSFLSAAITAGLFVGRKPRMAEAMGGVARAAVPFALALGVIARPAVVGPQAQTGSVEPPPGTCPHGGLGNLLLDNCEGYEHLLDVVPWDDAFVTGGLWWAEGKPGAAISIPRGLDTPPEPVSQTVTWSGTDFGDNQVDYEVTETYSFGTLQEGGCCAVFYEGSGTKTTTRAEGETVVETREASGRLEDIHPLGTQGFLSNEPVGIPFSEITQVRGQPEDSCVRGLAWQQDDNEDGAATWDSLVIDGEPQTTSIDTDAIVFIGCELPEFTYERAFALAPPPPAADDPARFDGPVIEGRPPPERCPVRQEFARYVWNAGQFEGVHTETLAELYLEPNAPQCDYGGLPGFGTPVAFGEGGRGNTRHELLYRLAMLNDPVAEAARIADDEDTFFGQFRTTSIPPHERCEVGPDGVPLPPEGFTTEDPDAASTGGITIPSDAIPTCTYVSIHSPGTNPGVSSLRGLQLEELAAIGGQVMIRTEYVLDGPNVTIRAHLPWGKYVYRCHHCQPGDAAITEFISSLHRFGVDRGFGDPDAGKGDVDPTPEPVGQDETTATTAPGFTEETEFTPIEEEEGISEEEAALIGLVGLLGSMGLLGASLEGTGLKPRDIGNAIRSGDLTGGVEKPPELLDEDGDPLYVNDGSYPEAPVGHVWWGVDEEEGRWVSREEAQELVEEARAADEALEQDRAEALIRQRRQADDDWEDLIETSRAEAAADRARAAVERARSEILFGTGPEDGGEIGAAWEAAMEAGEQDLVDFIDRQDGLTPEQIVAIYDAINRRGRDQAALDAIPEVNVLRETAEETLEDLAWAAEQAGQPGVAWILRNPGTSLRVGAAVATGGYSEFIAVPIDITQRLQAAQERSLAENGRMMNNEELFGELGWLLGTEAVYEVGGRLVGHGLGAVFSSTDEVAEAALRSGDEAAPTVGLRPGDALETTATAEARAARLAAEEAAEGSAGAEARRRGADALEQATETGSREGVETGAREGTEAGTKEGLEEGLEEGAEEAAEAGARPSGDAGAPRGSGAGTKEGLEEGLEEGAEEAVESGARRVDEGQLDVPPKGNEGIRDLETGARIGDDMVDQTGLPRQQLDEIENYTRENDLNVAGRSTNPHSRAALESGEAIPKPLDIKIKTGNDLDVMLGANPANRGQVTLFRPEMPNTAGMSDDLVEALNRRHAQRMAEWNKYRSGWTEGAERTMSVKGTTRTHRLNNGRIEVLQDGQWRGYAGDFDLVDITRADGTPLSAAEFQRHVDAMVERGLIEHGGEVRVMTDVLRNSPHPPGSAEWMEQARDVWDLRNNLENAHLEGSEIIIGINGREGLHRGPRIDEFLPWRGGFEAPGGELIDGTTFRVAGEAPNLDLTDAASSVLREMDDD